MIFRFALTDSAPALRTRLVAFDRVWDSLPEATPRVDAKARRDEIRIRQEHVAQRFFP